MNRAEIVFRVDKGDLSASDLIKRYGNIVSDSQIKLIRTTDAGYTFKLGFPATDKQQVEQVADQLRSSDSVHVTQVSTPTFYSTRSSTKSLRNSTVPNTKELPRAAVPAPPLQLSKYTSIKSPSPVVRRSRSKSKSRSPSVVRRSRSRSRSKSRSPSVVRRSRSKSPSVVRRSRSKSPSVVRRSRSKSPSVVKRSRSKSPSVVRRSRSKSPSVVERSRSKSPSVVRRSRSKSPSVVRRSRSKSPSVVRRSRSPIRFGFPAVSPSRSVSPSKRPATVRHTRTHRTRTHHGPADRCPNGTRKRRGTRVCVPYYPPKPRCPNGQWINRRTRQCGPRPPRKPRCPKGTHKNRKTMHCEPKSHNSHSYRR